MSQDQTKIMVAIDFSASSDHALHYAVDLAERLSARLYLVHITHPPKAAQVEMDGPVTLEALRARVAERAPIETHMRPGEAVSGLLNVIRELSPHMVVVGSHGHGAVRRAILGGVADRLCRESPVPVLVVPAPERGRKAEHAEPSSASRPPAPGSAEAAPGSAGAAPASDGAAPGKEPGA